MKPEHLKLERDRQTVNSFDLAMLTKNMWFESGRNEQVVTMIAEEYPDLEYAHWGTPELVKEACYKAFREKHPGAVIARSSSELQEMINKGMSRETVVYVGSTYGDVVQSSTSYRSEPRERPAAPCDTMRKFLTDNRQFMRTPAIVAFKDLIERSTKWKM